MPNYATPGHPYSAQSIYVTVSPVYKDKSKSHSDFLGETSKLPSINPLRLARSERLIKPSEEVRAQSAPAIYKYPPHVDYKRKLITNNFIQNTPWCRDMYRWFTPDRTRGVWHDGEDYERFRRTSFEYRLPEQEIYHRNKGLLPSYCGYVPGQHFRFGGTWGRETVNAKMIGIQRSWESTSYFQDRPIGA